ncbi:hypothetical protein CRG98_006709 [Punica granatum]|uniref:CCHC-type domain-containing protein n=1 Tax=Punica granatum TaxID=22663 RepID=A0A2I0KWR0_PUNGR|nr:hypothetical protein CRG98_006709 [Punica granatum]
MEKGEESSRMCAAQSEREMTHQFLMGLGFEFNTVRSNILSHEPAHSLNKVLAMILHEEDQNGAVFMGRVAGRKPELQGGNNQTYGGSRGGANGTGTKTCYHYGRPGHFKSACWLLHGYSANWNSKAMREKGKLGFSGRRMGEMIREAQTQPDGLQHGDGLGPNQFCRLEAHQARFERSSLSPNQISGLQAHQAQLGQPRPHHEEDDWSE